MFRRAPVLRYQLALILAYLRPIDDALHLEALERLADTVLHTLVSQHVRDLPRRVVILGEIEHFLQDGLFLGNRFEL